MEWIDGIQNALHYIEENIAEELNAEDIAARAYISAFHFQRVFSILCGVSLGEYIRLRRLTLAGSELSADPSSRVIDIAVKYGYDSPDSFTKAFTRFHGISPSSAKEKGASLKTFAPLRIKLTLEGGSIMEYRIVEKPAFTVIGMAKKFSMDNSYQEIPKFWSEHYSQGKNSIIVGMYGVCIDNCEDKGQFEYMIADNYTPWEEIPEGCVTRTIPAHTWAIFPCRGKMPTALQSVNTDIFKEWLPNNKEYQLDGECNIEMYSPGDTQADDYYSEIWIPVKSTK